jgi:hypothetical protein
MTDIKKNLSKFFYNSILDENIVETNDGVPLFPILNKFVIEDLHKNSEKINIDGLKMDSFDHVQIVSKKIPLITETLILKQQDTFQFPESCSQDYPKKEKNLKINKFGNDINNIKNNIQASENMQATSLNNFFNTISSSKQKKPRKKPAKKIYESFSIDSSSSRDADSDEEEAVRRITAEETEATDIVIKDDISYDSSYDGEKNGKVDKPGKPMLHELDVFKKNQPRERKNLLSKEITTTIVLNSEDDSSKSFDPDQHSSSTSDDDKDDSLSIEMTQIPKSQSTLVIPEPLPLPPIKEDVIEEKNGTFYGFKSLIDSVYDIISYDKYISQMLHFVKCDPISNESKEKFEQLLHFFSAQIAFDVRAEQKKNDISKIDHVYDLIVGKAPSLKYDIINGKRQVNEESKKIREEYIADNLRKESNKHNNNGMNNDKELDLIYKTKKSISENLQLNQSNHGSFLTNLLETALSTVNQNDFLASDFTNTCNNLDWAPYLIDHKFDESDLQYFKGTPLCYISGKEIKIGDDVSYIRLIENDPERIDNWQGYTKPAETPYLQEELTKSLKSYYFLKRTTIDLNTQEFSLFKMSILMKKINNHLSQSNNQMDITPEKPVRTKQPKEIEAKVVNNKKSTTKKTVTQKPKEEKPKQTNKRKLTKESDSSTPPPKQTTKRKLTKEINEPDSSTPLKKRKITEPTKKVVEIIAQTTPSSKFEELLNANNDCDNDDNEIDVEDTKESPIKFFNKSVVFYVSYDATHVIIINNLWKHLYFYSRLDHFNNNGDIKSLHPHEQFLVKTNLNSLTEEDGPTLFISNYMIEYQKTYPKTLTFPKITKAILDFFSLLIIPKPKQMTQLLNTNIFEGSVDGINLNEEAYFLNFIFRNSKKLKETNSTNYFNKFLSKTNDLDVPLSHIPIFQEHERLWITLFSYLFCKKINS